MIKIDNSAKKRIFYLKEYKDESEFEELKTDILDVIKKKEYKKLITLENKKYSNQFSVFIFYKAIKKSINQIGNLTIRRKLQQLDWFKVLVGDILEIRELLKKNKKILSNLQQPNFIDYKNIFEKLYKDQLSGKDELKKEFFNLFEDINVCPYCNRNFINPIYKNTNLGGDNKKQSPDIEHFFPKSLYPFLSLSISNLLPSCAFCNKIKSDVDTYKNNCLSPYEVQEDDFTFDFELEDSSLKTITLISKNGNKNSDILHLETLYNEVHRNYINEIFDDILKYPIIYKESLEKFDILESDYKNTFRNYFDEKDFNKQPLSKMTKNLMKKIKTLQ